MKSSKIVVLGAIMVMAFLFTSCSSYQECPAIGSTQEQVESFIKSYDYDVDKTTYPNIWYVDDEDMMIQFDSEGKVAHIAIGGSSTNIASYMGTENGEKQEQVAGHWYGDRVYKCGNRYMLYYAHIFSGAIGVIVSEAEVKDIKKAMEEGSDKYDKPESLIGNEDAVDEIHHGFFRTMFFYW